MFQETPASQDAHDIVLDTEEPREGADGWCRWQSVPVPPGFEEGDAGEVLCQGQVGSATGTKGVDGLSVTIEEPAEGAGV